MPKIMLMSVIFLRMEKSDLSSVTKGFDMNKLLSHIPPMFSAIYLNGFL